MQKTPTYIGIFVLDPKSASKDLRNFSKQCIEEVLGRVNSMYVNQDYNNFETRYSQPKDNYHITTLYIGGNIKALKPAQNQQLNQFEAQKKVPIKIKFCVYVPQTIIVGYCHELGEVKCDNSHPHVTLMLTGETKPVQSNAVLQEVFKEKPNICQEIEQLEPVTELKAKYKGKSIFIIKKEITVDGITGDNFKHGNKK